MRILGAGPVERFGEVVEALGDRRQLLHLRLLDAGGVLPVLELHHAAGKIGERLEHASEDEKENEEDQPVDGEPDEREAIGVMPGFGDLVGRLAGDDHGAERPDPRHGLDRLFEDEGGTA